MTTTMMADYGLFTITEGRIGPSELNSGNPWWWKALCPILQGVKTAIAGGWNMPQKIDPLRDLSREVWSVKKRVFDWFFLFKCLIL